MNHVEVLKHAAHVYEDAGICGTKVLRGRTVRAWILTVACAAPEAMARGRTTQVLPDAPVKAANATEPEVVEAAPEGSETITESADANEVIERHSQNRHL